VPAIGKFPGAPYPGSLFAEFRGTDAGHRKIPDRQTVGVVFSKDRAMQLDATALILPATAGPLDRIQVKVLYKCSTPLHETAVSGASARYPQVAFRASARSVGDDLLSMLETGEHVLSWSMTHCCSGLFSKKHDRQPGRFIPRRSVFLSSGENTGYC